MKSAPAALQASLQGTLTAPHRFMLTTRLEEGEFLEQQSTHLDERIEAGRRPFEV